jgi:hypothetical protein
LDFEFFLVVEARSFFQEPLELFLLFAIVTHSFSYIRFCQQWNTAAKTLALLNHLHEKEQEIVITQDDDF